MFENITKRFERNKSTDDLYVYTEKYHVEVVVTFRKTYKVRALNAKEAGIKAVDRIKKRNKSYLDKGLHFIEATPEKAERIKDD
tara:strand:+ start:304 stop:555 length:252 start_codon:yes stop_codon:yes gene_type:complete